VEFSIAAALFMNSLGKHTRSTPHRPATLRAARVFALITALAVMPGALAFAAGNTDAEAVRQLFLSGEQTKAFERLDSLLAGRGATPELRFLKGVLKVEAKQFDEALVVFQELTETYPELPEPYNNLAVLRASRGEFAEARTALEGAIRANPDYGVAYQNLGDVYTQLARMSYQQALKLDPSNGSIPPRMSLLRELSDPSSRYRTNP
jgi:Flp pilus assembly protein TadD